MLKKIKANFNVQFINFYFFYVFKWLKFHHITLKRLFFLN